MQRTKDNAGKFSRIGEKFYREIERIKNERLKNGNDLERLSTGKITNMIIRNNFWKEISESIIQASTEEVYHYGN